MPGFLCDPPFYVEFLREPIAVRRIRFSPSIALSPNQLKIMAAHIQRQCDAELSFAKILVCVCSGIGFTILARQIRALRALEPSFGYRLEHDGRIFLLAFTLFPGRFRVVTHRTKVFLLSTVPFSPRPWDISDLQSVHRVLSSVQSQLCKWRISILSTFLKDCIPHTVTIQVLPTALHVLFSDDSLLSVTLDRQTGIYEFAPGNSALISAVREWDSDGVRSLLHDLTQPRSFSPLAAVGRELEFRRINFHRARRSLTVFLHPFQSLRFMVLCHCHWELACAHNFGSITVVGQSLSLRIGPFVVALMRTLGRFLEYAASARELSPTFAFPDALSFSVDLDPPRPSLVRVSVANLRRLDGFATFAASAVLPAVVFQTWAIPQPFVSALPQQFVALVKGLRHAVNALQAAFVHVACPWSICMPTSRLTFFLCYRHHPHKYCISVAFTPPDGFHVSVPPFAPSAIIVLPLTTFSQCPLHFSRRNDSDRHSETSARLAIGQLAELKQKIDTVFAERQLLSSARFTLLKPTATKTAVVAFCPSIPSWISLSVSLSGMGIALDIQESREPAAQAVKKLVELDFPNRVTKMAVFKFIFSMLDPNVPVVKLLFHIFYEITTTDIPIDWVSLLASGVVEKEVIRFSVMVKGEETIVRIPRSTGQRRDC
jgi:hypothetical protein